MARYANAHKEGSIRGRVTSRRHFIDLMRDEKRFAGTPLVGLGTDELKQLPTISERTYRLLALEGDVRRKQWTADEAIDVHLDVQRIIAVVRAAKISKIAAIKEDSDAGV